MSKRSTANNILLKGSPTKTTGGHESKQELNNHVSPTLIDNKRIFWPSERRIRRRWCYTKRSGLYLLLTPLTAARPWMLTQQNWHNKWSRLDNGTSVSNSWFHGHQLPVRNCFSGPVFVPQLVWSYSFERRWRRCIFRRERQSRRGTMPRAKFPLCSTQSKHIAAGVPGQPSRLISLTCLTLPTLLLLLVVHNHNLTQQTTQKTATLTFWCYRILWYSRPDGS